MDWLTRFNLNRMRRRLSPRRAFRVALYARLAAEGGFVARPAMRLRPVAVGLCAFALLVSGTGAFAYESPDVVEGHPLFAMKQGIETAEAAIAKTSPERAAAFYAKMLEKRLKEAERIANGRQERLIERAADERERYESVRERVKLREESKSRLGPEVRDLVKRVRDGDGTREEKRKRFKEEAKKLIDSHRRGGMDGRDRDEDHPSYEN
ncbi:hypothetical protein EPO34_01330 [Patescibacteria group bacterium]|nr:MAG: hypothetical protein EPO34_01330 [Patescibacteria group bacterium]